MRNGISKKIALGGVLAALAVVIMSIGGMIPIATFACPVLCILLTSAVFRLCGTRIAWAWYVAVAVLSILLGPDKEAAALYVLFGYYPIIKRFFDRLRFTFLWKLFYFNALVFLLYAFVLRIMGLQRLETEYRSFGLIGLVVLLVLGNVAFFLLDRLLVRIIRLRRSRWK